MSTTLSQPVTFRPSQEAFAAAIAAGWLSDESGNIYYAGRYMYMHSDARGDYFKNVDTRQYLVVPPQ